LFDSWDTTCYLFNSLTTLTELYWRKIWRKTKKYAKARLPEWKEVIASFNAFCSLCFGKGVRHDHMFSSTITESNGKYIKYRWFRNPRLVSNFPDWRVRIGMERRRNSTVMINIYRSTPEFGCRPSEGVQLLCHMILVTVEYANASSAKISTDLL
jgi:hypothetical protein